jgi:hypothetical protein
VILEDLRDREDGFDGKAHIAQKGDVEGSPRQEGQEDVDEEEGAGEVSKEDEVPVAPRID